MSATITVSNTRPTSLTRPLSSVGVHGNQDVIVTANGVDHPDLVGGAEAELCRTVDGANAWVAAGAPVEDVSGAVGRVVVDHQEVEVETPFVGEAENAVAVFLDVVALVVRRRKHEDPTRRCGHGRARGALGIRRGGGVRARRIRSGHDRLSVVGGQPPG